MREACRERKRDRPRGSAFVFVFVSFFKGKKWQHKTKWPIIKKGGATLAVCGEEWMWMLNVNYVCISHSVAFEYSVSDSMEMNRFTAQWNVVKHDVLCTI